AKTAPAPDPAPAEAPAPDPLPAPVEPPPPKAPPVVPPPVKPAPPDDQEPPAAKPSKKFPTTVVVARLGKGHFQSIAEAVRQVRPGTRIRVTAGVYRESLVLDKALEVVADADAGEVVVLGADGPCVRLQTEYAVVRGLTLRVPAADARPGPAVEVKQGRLVLENCDISSGSAAGVVASGLGSNPVLRSCKVHGCRAAGLLVQDKAECTAENCVLADNHGPGVEVREGGNP